MTANWQRVPMPQQIEALKRDRRGFPIPYVAEWSGEAPGDIVLWAAPFPEGIPVMMNARGSWHGKGTPILGHMNPERQRECMLGPRCQICRRELPDPPWNLIGGQIHTTLGEWWFSEPPVCDSCARYAVQVCPRLTGVTAARADVRVFVVQKMQLAAGLSNPLIGEERVVPWPGPELEALVIRGARLPYVLTFIKAQPIEFREVTVDEFLNTD